MRYLTETSVGVIFLSSYCLCFVVNFFTESCFIHDSGEAESQKSGQISQKLVNGAALDKSGRAAETLELSRLCSTCAVVSLLT